MRQTFTTAIGVLFVVFGLIGLSLTSVSLALVLRVDPALQHPLGFCEVIVALIDKIGAMGIGVLLLMRLRSVRILLPCVLIISALDSVAVYLWLMPPIPAGLDDIGRAGRAVGHMVALILPLVVYALTTGYLMLPRTRREFAEKQSLAAGI